MIGEMSAPDANEVKEEAVGIGMRNVPFVSEREFDEGPGFRAARNSGKSAGSVVGSGEVACQAWETRHGRGKGDMESRNGMDLG